MMAYLGGGHGPDLVVVRSHEDVGYPFTAVPQDPFVEVLGLRGCDAVLQSSVDHAVYALDLVVLGQHGNVILEGVRHPEALVAHVGDALVRVPILLLRQRLVDAVVKVLVVREDDVAADIVKLSFAVLSAPGGGMYGLRQRWTYEALGSDIGRGETTRSFVAVNDQP